MSLPDSEIGLLCAPLGEERLLGRVLTRLACLCAAAIGLLVVGQNLGHLAGDPLRLVWVLLLMAAIVTGVWLLSRLPKTARWDRFLLALALTLCLILRLVWVLAVRTPPQSDFGLMYNAARQAAVGDFSWTGPEGSYFWWWSYQIPFVLYQAAVWKVIPSLWALKTMNLLFMAGIDALIYAIACRFLTPRAALVPTLLYALYPASIHTAAVLTNQHISTFFLLLGMWLLLTGKDWPRMLLAGATFAVGNLMRPEAVILLATLLCCAVCLFLRYPCREVGKRLAAGVLALLVAYGGVSWAVCALITATGAAPYGVGNQVPEWKFVVGLDATGNGGYTERNAHVLAISDGQARRAEAQRVIANSFRESEDIPGFFLKKTALMWAEEEPFYWSTGFLDPAAEKFGLSVENILHRLETAEKAVYLLVWVCLPLSAFFLGWGKRREESGTALFCMIAVCAAFCIYLLIEVQPRYRYCTMPMLFLLSGLSAQAIQSWRGRTNQ